MRHCKHDADDSLMNSRLVGGPIETVHFTAGSRHLLRRVSCLLCRMFLGCSYLLHAAGFVLMVSMQIQSEESQDTKMPHHAR